MSPWSLGDELVRPEVGSSVIYWVTNIGQAGKRRRTCCDHHPVNAFGDEVSVRHCCHFFDSQKFRARRVLNFEPFLYRQITGSTNVVAAQTWVPYFNLTIQ